MCEPWLLDSGLSLASDSSDESRRGASSTSTTVSPLRPLTVTGTISSGRRPSSVALIAQLVAAQRPAVEVGPRHLELVGDLAGLLEHLLAAERVAQAVVDHRVDRLGVAHAEAEARLLEQVRRVAHRLHAAGDADVEVAGADRGVEDPGRAHAGRADLVDRLRGDLLRDAGLDLRLARGDLALAGLQDLAHDDVLDLLGGDVGALERGLDREPAELGGVDGARGRRPACRWGCGRRRG